MEHGEAMRYQRLAFRKVRSRRSSRGTFRVPESNVTIPHLQLWQRSLNCDSATAATQVAGWRGWSEVDRRIKQGEKGILIFAPILSEPKKPFRANIQVCQPAPSNVAR